MRTRILVAAAVLCSTLPFWGGAVEARGLTFEERVRAQEAVERVYYSHQVGAVRPFEEAVPRELLEAKVRTYLKQSAALERIWGAPVTSEMLRRETERMASETRMPERLRELFAALGDDAFLIQECIARPLLASRLVESYYGQDRALHAAERAEIESLRSKLVAGEIDPRAAHDRRRLVEGPSAAPAAPFPLRIVAGNEGSAAVPPAAPAIEETPDEFLVRVPVAAVSQDSGDAVAVYAVAKSPLGAWWIGVRDTLDEASVSPVADEGADLPAPAVAATSVALEPSGAAPATPLAGPCDADDTWNNGAFDNEAPAARAYHTAVWTGTRMIVWGGRDGTGYKQDGFRYDPATDTWARISEIGAPEGRAYHTAVWTGTRMVVWGGQGEDGLLGTGGMYDAAGDFWVPIATGGAPGPRVDHTAVWTGTRMIVWGGSDGNPTNPTTYGDGAALDPITDTWFPVSAVGAPESRTWHTAVVLGGRMIVWGGAKWDAGASQWVDLDTGGRYDFATDLWTPTSMTGVPAARRAHIAVAPAPPSTVSVMTVWGGKQGSVLLRTGGRYDPATDLWTVTLEQSAPVAREGHRAVWAGTSLLMWGGRTSNSALHTGATYSPSANSWVATSVDSAPEDRIGHSLVWTGSRVIVWGGYDFVYDRYRGSGSLYDYSSARRWYPTRAGVPSRSRHTAVWTGHSMLVWGGENDDGVLAYGGRYDPATDNWSSLSTLSQPAARAGHTAVWTGSKMIVWGGATATARLNTGGLYDPATDSWAATTLTSAPTARTGHTAVWTGDRMIVWGGLSGTMFYATGARYDPVANTWSATPVPGTTILTVRAEHTAVWTGSHMAVWGGRNATTYFATGARFDPATNVWIPIADENAPTARSRHTAVWIGTEMIVWGGFNGSSYLGDGGRYDATTGAWGPLSSEYAPSGRADHTAVWTGRDMVVWGGRDASSFYDDGARYSPSSDFWTPLSLTTAPSARAEHTGVWTGTFLLVWGGEDSTGFLGTGGRYSLGHLTDDDGDGYTECDGDCNDGNATVSPQATDICNGVDDNCNGVVDDGLAKTPYYRDADGDGYGNSSASLLTCLPPTGYATAGLDCDDTNSLVYPGRAETCNGLDDDCDGSVDDGVLIPIYPDVDGDGLGDWELASYACSVPAGYSIVGGDNCVTVANPDQADLDGDRAGDACDICPDTPDPGQTDWDGDGYGDACELGALLADADLSGRVDGLDLAWMGREWGRRWRYPVYDANGVFLYWDYHIDLFGYEFAFALDYTKDEVIDGEDLSSLAVYFGQPSGAEPPAVP